MRARLLARGCEYMTLAWSRAFFTGYATQASCFPEEFGIESEDGKNLLEAHPGQRVLLYCDRPELRSGLFLRRAWLTD